jgi:hypothetical protein
MKYPNIETYLTWPSTIDGPSTQTTESIYSLALHRHVSFKKRICRLNSFNTTPYSSQSVTNISSTRSRNIHTKPRQTSCCQPGYRMCLPSYVIAILTMIVRDRATRLRNHYNLLASTLRIRGEARMSRVPSHLRGIKIKELREMQKRGITREKQLLTDVLGTRLLASANRPLLKRYSPWKALLIEENLRRMKCLIQTHIQVFPCLMNTDDC